MQERARARDPAPRARAARRRGRRPAAVIRRSASALAASRRGSASTRPRSPAVPAIGGCHAASVTETACARRASEKSETPADATETSCESSPWSGSAPASAWSSCSLAYAVSPVARAGVVTSWPSRRRASRVAAALESRTTAPACDEPAGADLRGPGGHPPCRSGRRRRRGDGRPRLRSRAPTGWRRRARAPDRCARRDRGRGRGAARRTSGRRPRRRSARAAATGRSSGARDRRSWCRRRSR